MGKRDKRESNNKSKRSIMKNKIVTIFVCLGFASGSAFAAGFGVSSQNTNTNSATTNAAVAKLLAQANGTAAASTSVRSAPVAQTSASDSAISNPNSASNAAFAKTTQQLMPMSPEQIKTLR